MNGKSFIDTNVFVYAIDARDPRKQAQAQALLLLLEHNRSGVISPQVVHEFANNLIGKLKLSLEVVSSRCEDLEVFTQAPWHLQSALSAISLMRASSLSFWDACIVAAAAQANCTTLYTEDLNHGQTIAGVKIVNPFIET